MLTFDLWPWKSIGFQILLRSKYVPSLVKIHWRMLILECSHGCFRRTDGSVTYISLRNFVGEGIIIKDLGQKTFICNMKTMWWLQRSFLNKKHKYSFSCWLQKAWNVVGHDYIVFTERECTRNLLGQLNMDTSKSLKTIGQKWQLLVQVEMGLKMLLCKCVKKETS